MESSSTSNYLEIVDKLSKLLSSSNLNDPDPSLPTVSQPEWSRILFFKPLCDRKYPFNVISSTMPKIWKPKGNIKISEYFDGSFSARFDNPEDLDFVMEKGPWKINNHLLVMERCLPNKLPKEYLFSNAEFWIQFHGLPINLLSVDYISTLAARIGSIRPPTLMDSKQWVMFARVKVSIDITKPLARTISTPMGNGSYCKVELRYERLPKFCTFCGRLGHGILKCSIHQEYSALLNDNWSKEQKDQFQKMLNTKLDFSICASYSTRFYNKNQHDAIEGGTRTSPDKLATGSNAQDESSLLLRKGKSFFPNQFPEDMFVDHNIAPNGESYSLEDNLGRSNQLTTTPPNSGKNPLTVTGEASSSLPDYPVTAPHTSPIFMPTIPPGTTTPTTELHIIPEQLTNNSQRASEVSGIIHLNCALPSSKHPRHLIRLLQILNPQNKCHL